MIQWRQKETEVRVKALESGSAQPSVNAARYWLGSAPCREGPGEEVIGFEPCTSWNPVSVN